MLEVLVCLSIILIVFGGLVALGGVGGFDEDIIIPATCVCLVGILLLVSMFVAHQRGSEAERDLAFAANVAHYEQVIQPNGTVEHKFVWNTPAK